MELTHSQQAAYQLAETSSDNLFICGKPGAGKSVLIEYLMEHGSKPYTLAAPTGLAALNIGGKTLHSLFQISVSSGIFHPSYNIFTNNENVVNHIRYKIKHLIIDEASMVRADMLDYIDRLLRTIKNIPLPFGGVQIILVGDMYQLPPVAKALDLAQLRDASYASPFIFSAFSFKGFKAFELTEVIRQKDPRFLAILDSVRTSQTSFKDLKDLNTRLVGKINHSAIKLVSTNKEAEEINSSEMKALDGEEMVYKADYTGKWPEFPAPLILKIRVGSRVMVKSNNSDKSEVSGASGKISNGTLGVVTEVNKSSVGIETSSGEKFTIHRQTSTLRIKMKFDGEWRESIVATFNQLPIQLAWAISIHKSQGQTFDSVYIDVKRIFASGQLYVALSRCKSLDGIFLASPILSKHVKTNNHVTKFYATLQK